MTSRPRSPLWHPKHWPVWLCVFILQLVVLLPMPYLIRLGKTLGHLLFYIAKRRRHITEVNIQRCFPELSADDQQQLVLDIFKENGAGMLEAVAGWLKPNLQATVQFHNKQVIEDGIRSNQGLLLLSAHFTHIDICGKFFGSNFPLNVLYRPQNNAVINYIMERGRQQFLETAAIHQHDMRAMVRCLKSGQLLWYPFDQDHGRKSSVFAEFFGVTAATLSIPSRLIKMSGCRAVFCYHYRDDKGIYHIEFEALPELDGSSPKDEATLLNKRLETHLRRYPAQYMWVHRRFKTRPEGETSFY